MLYGSPNCSIPLVPVIVNLSRYTSLPTAFVADVFYAWDPAGCLPRGAAAARNVLETEKVRGPRTRTECDAV